MSSQLVRILLFLPFLFIRSTGNPEPPRSRSFSVIQTPPFLNVSEGSDVTLNCNVEGNVSSRWFVKWMKMGKKEEIKISSRILVIKNERNKSSILTLRSTVVDDSGIYHCVTSDYKMGLENSEMGSTNVTIWEKPYVAVNQTPPHASRRAGANVSITCSFSKVANATLMEVTWYKDNQKLRSPKPCEKLRHKVILRLTNVDVEDSGNYVCKIRIGNRTGSGNGTRVNIAAANLLVIQSPPSIQTTEGENLTMDCRVQGKGAKHLHRVSWYKMASDGQKSLMTHGTGVLKDRASLFLRNIKQEDSGNYICDVDKYGQGNGTRVTILAGRQTPLQNTNADGDGRQADPPPKTGDSGIGIPVGVGVALGTLIFLLLLGFVVWRSKRKNKGASENPSDVEPTVAKEAKKHPLTKQMSDVTYADIRFHKREAKPDTEVVYAEVRLGTKRPENRD